MIIQFGDLFAGGGGTTTGAKWAARARNVTIRGFAVNHWVTSVMTHTTNHPEFIHRCNSLADVNPLDVAPDGNLDLMCASPECVFFSRARGAVPINDQRRSSAGDVIRWCNELNVRHLIVENVPEFREWGPLHPDTPENRVRKIALRPVKERAGEFFRAFVGDLEHLGYVVSWRILCCADYGDPTSRKRFFLQASKHGAPRWPQKTHGEGLKPYRTAREIIDWTMRGISIYGRKKRLVPATMRRNIAGLEKFTFPALSAAIGEFEIVQQPGDDVYRPYVLRLTAEQAAAVALRQDPSIVVLRNNQAAFTLDDPLATICTSAGHFALSEPVLTSYITNGYGGKDAVSIDQPLPTVTARWNHHGLGTPFILPVTHQMAGDIIYSYDEPLRTQTAQQEYAWAEAFLTEYHKTKGGIERIRSVDEPLPTQDTSNRYGLVNPYLINFYGNGAALDIDEPLDTVTTKERFAACSPRLQEQGGLYMVDVLFRMLKARELARAQGFPDSYIFTGSTEEQVAQIGNAVPVHTACALCTTAIEDLQRIDAERAVA